MEETVEDIIKVSSKGQIVIPKAVREKLGVKAGERLLVVSRGKEILLQKAKEMSIEEIAAKIEPYTKKAGVDTDKLVEEAIEWARKSK
jgi:antitoxin PrlF